MYFYSLRCFASENIGCMMEFKHTFSFLEISTILLKIALCKLKQSLCYLSFIIQCKPNSKLTQILNYFKSIFIKPTIEAKSNLL